MLSRRWTRSSLLALTALVTSAAAAPAADLVVEGTGKVDPDTVEVGPNSQAFSVSLKGTLTVGDESYRFKGVADVVQIFPPGYTSSFWSEDTLDFGQGDTLTISNVAHYDWQTNCYQGHYTIIDGTGIFAGAQGSGMTLTCPVEGVFRWEGTIR
jgi:hypothetical protein